MSSAKSSVNGLNSCKCCPYGFHIDTDFVSYCEALLTALYGTKRLSQTFHCNTSNSLRRKINSALSVLNSANNCGSNAVNDNAFLTYCDYNSNNITANGNKSHNNSMKSHLSRQIVLPESVAADNSLNEVVAKFEETWRESKKRSSQSSQSQRSDTDFSHQMNITPPASPTPSSCTTSSEISRTVLSQIRDQMSSSITRIKELEDEIKEIPYLKQKILILREEKKNLVKRLDESKSEMSCINYDSQTRSHMRQLERSGLITPPLTRRKALLKSESDTEDDYEEYDKCPSPPQMSKVSSKNINLADLNERLDAWNQTSRNSLNLVSVSTNTEIEENHSNDSLIDDKIEVQNKVNDHNLSFATLSSLSITPMQKSEPVGKRSIGISTSLAPSLPRKNVTVMTDMRADDVLSIRELEANRPALVSWGTDPIAVELFDVQCQTAINTKEVAVATQTYHKKSISVCTTELQRETRENCAVQTNKVYYYEKAVQANQKCAKCDLRQMETIGVGDNDIYGMPTADKAIDTLKERPTSLDVLNVSPDSRASSVQSIRLCDKCNEAITSVAKDFIVGPNDKISSPTMHSRIPRPIHSTGSLERRTINDKIIEESQNEILVYKIPTHHSLDSSPTKRNTPPLPPPRRKDYNKSKITTKEDKLIDDVFKISDISESEESEESSNSSEEGSYDIETGKIAKSSQRKRVEPNKEVKAALKVLNDNLIKPEKTNRSALSKSLAIIEKEWFRIAAAEKADSQVVEDYIDCFETFSKHLLNRVINLSDMSGNTAIHYAISYCNFDVVSVLLDSKVCDVNKSNKAGYTPTMLVSLARIRNETQKAVIRRLYSLGDVNVKAKQNGQTALMLAASHGQFNTCKILMECGAAINLQDNDGSTALMCAAEHGHSDAVKLLLSHPDCDPTIVDNDGSTALRIAMDNGHNDIGLMLYASTSMLSRGSSPYASLRRTQSKAIASALRRTGSFSYSHTRVTPHTFQLMPSPPSRSRHSSASTSKSSKM